MRQQARSILPEVQSSGSLGVGLVAFKPFPQDMVVLSPIHKVFFREIQSFRNTGPISARTGWRCGYQVGLRWQGKLAGQDRGGCGRVSPVGCCGIENVSHREGGSVV